MITIINPTRLTRQPFFKDLINYLDQHDDVILRQIKAQFPDQPVDKLMEEYIKAGFILRENKRYTLNLPFLESADLVDLNQEVFVLSDKDRFQGTAVAREGLWEQLCLAAMYVPLLLDAIVHLISAP